MKRKLCIVLSLAMVFLFAACSNNDRAYDEKINADNNLSEVSEDSKESQTKTEENDKEKNSGIAKTEKAADIKEKETIINDERKDDTAVESKNCEDAGNDDLSPNNDENNDNKTNDKEDETVISNDSPIKNKDKDVRDGVPQKYQKDEPQTTTP